MNSEYKSTVRVFKLDNEQIEELIVKNQELLKTRYVIIDGGSNTIVVGDGTSEHERILKSSPVPTGVYEVGNRKYRSYRVNPDLLSDQK